jgi:hypothetical protein
MGAQAKKLVNGLFERTLRHHVRVALSAGRKPTLTLPLFAAA